MVFHPGGDRTQEPGFRQGENWERQAGSGRVHQCYPTGPLHVGHGRGAAIGDALASILNACGYRAFKEYYINDVGSQMNTLGQSVYLRYLRALGKDVEFPDYCYPIGSIET